MSLFVCIKCGESFEPGSRLTCPCGGLLEVQHSFPPIDKTVFDKRLNAIEAPYNSGVWRFKELIHPGIALDHIITRPEGNTNLYWRREINDFTGVGSLTIKHEGENPTGSFKDRGMTVGVSEAVRQGASTVTCASTGNTSASMSAYAAQAGLKNVVFVPEGAIAYGKLAQALAYGAKVIQIMGNFDDAMRLVREEAESLGFYILNSVNPWRLEGQKSIIFELLQQRNWKPPDWIVVPAGNLGNTSAFGKALRELLELGLIDEMPRIASVQAEGANPFYDLWSSQRGTLIPVEKPETIASAIKIGNPVSWEKAIRAITETDGIVEQVSDNEIMEAKAVIDRCGIGCEPASAASVAGARKLVEKGRIDPSEEVVCILTGNLLKDPETTVRYHTGILEGIEQRFANKPIVAEPDKSSIEKALNEASIREHEMEVSIPNGI
jgi:threonine synthase